jgi:site-specific DNA recombinase
MFPQMNETRGKAVKAYILARVSSKDQEDNYSIPAQIKNLEQYCQHKDLKVIKTVKLVESSTKGGRKEFNKVINEIKGRSDLIAIVVDCVDRLQRSFLETVELGRLAREGKIEIHFKREGLVISKDSNSFAYMMWNFAVMMAEAYVLQLSDNVKRGNKEKFANGELAGLAPLGYYNGLNAQEKPWVYVDENKREFITWLFEAYSTDQWSYTMLAKEAANRGYLTTSKPDRYRTSTVAKILRNPFYCGILRRNGRETEHVYESIISKDLFYRVQDLIELRSRKKKKNNSIPFIFNHVFRCEECQGAIVGYSPKRGFNYYRCSNHKCPNYRINKSEKELLSEISLSLAQGHIPQDVIKKVVETLKQSVEAKNKFQTETINQLTLEKKKINNRLDKMYLDKLDDCITKEQYDSLQQVQSKRLRDIDVELSKLTSSQETFYLTAERVLNLVSRAKELFDQATTSEKQNILKLLSYNSTADGKEYRLKLKEPFISIFDFQERTSWHGC